MTRLGAVLLLFFVGVLALFALLLRHGGGAARHDAPPPPAAAGPLIPVASVVPAALNDTWGQARAGGGRAHHAIDIIAPRGTPVLAAAAGVVEKLFESHDGGHTVYIRRNDAAWIDYYAHLESYAPDLREGVAVRAGQRIGTVGSSGDADPGAPHLHYEIKRLVPGERWWQGREVNPYPILAGRR